MSIADKIKTTPSEIGDPRKAYKRLNFSSRDLWQYPVTKLIDELKKNDNAIGIKLLYGPKAIGKTTALMKIFDSLKVEDIPVGYLSYSEVSDEELRDVRDGVKEIGLRVILLDDFADMGVEKFSDFVLSYLGNRFFVIITGKSSSDYRRIVDIVDRVNKVIGESENVRIDLKPYLLKPVNFPDYVYYKKENVVIRVEGRRKLRALKRIITSPLYDYLPLNEMSEARNALNTSSRPFVDSNSNPSSPRPVDVSREYEAYLNAMSLYPAAVYDGSKIIEIKDSLRKFIENLPSEEYDLLGEISKSLFKPLDLDKEDKTVRSLFSKFLLLPISSPDNKIVPIPIDGLVVDVLNELFGISIEYDKRVISLILHILILLEIFRSINELAFPLPIRLSYFEEMPVVSVDLTIDVHDLELIVFLANFELRLLDYRSDIEEAIRDLSRYNAILERIALYGLSRAVAPVVLIRNPLKNPRTLYDRFRFAIEEDPEELEGYRENLKKYRAYGRPPQRPAFRDVWVFYDPAFLALLAGTRKGKMGRS